MNHINLFHTAVEFTADILRWSIYCHNKSIIVNLKSKIYFSNPQNQCHAMGST